MDGNIGSLMHWGSTIISPMVHNPKHLFEMACNLRNGTNDFNN